MVLWALTDGNYYAPFVATDPKTVKGIWYASKRMQQFVKNMRRFFAPHFYGFCQTHRNSANVTHFHGKRRRNPAKNCNALQDSALRRGHQSAALYAGENATIYAFFSSAAAPSLLHSF